MSDELAPIWTRLDDHSGKIQELTVDQRLTEKMVDNHTEEFRRTGIESARQHSELVVIMGDISTEVKTVSNDYHQRQGAARITTWLIPTLLTGIAVLIGYITLVQG